MLRAPLPVGKAIPQISPYACASLKAPAFIYNLMVQSTLLNLLCTAYCVLSSLCTWQTWGPAMTGKYAWGNTKEWAWAWAGHGGGAERGRGGGKGRWWQQNVGEWTRKGLGEEGQPGSDWGERGPTANCKEHKIINVGTAVTNDDWRLHAVPLIKARLGWVPLLHSTQQNHKKKQKW